MSMTQIQHDKWALFHPDGNWYTFLTHSDNTVHILHNGKNCQSVYRRLHSHAGRKYLEGKDYDESHSDGCYKVSVGRNFWDALVSQGFETNK